MNTSQRSLQPSNKELIAANKCNDNIRSRSQKLYKGTTKKKKRCLWGTSRIIVVLNIHLQRHQPNTLLPSIQAHSIRHPSNQTHNILLQSKLITNIHNTRKKSNSKRNRNSKCRVDPLISVPIQRSKDITNRNTIRTLSSNSSSRWETLLQELILRISEVQIRTVDFCSDEKCH